MSQTEKIVCFAEETMLLAWAESNTRGRTVTFQLPEEGDEHPFRHFTVKTGKRAGQRFYMTLVQIDDDERPVERKPSQDAFLMCRDEQFWHYLSERSFLTIETEDEARDAMLELLSTGSGVKVTSRSMIDTNPSVRAAFQMYVEKPFNEYRTALGVGL
jgi:hypothetical protein